MVQIILQTHSTVHNSLSLTHTHTHAYTHTQQEMANEATTLHNLFLTIFDRNQNKQTTLSLSTLINYQDNSIIRLDPSPPTDNDATTAEGQNKRNKVESSTTDTDTSIDVQNRRNKAQLVLWCKPAFLAEKEDKTNRAIRRKKDIIDVIATYTRREMRTALLNESRKPHIQCSLQTRSTIKTSSSRRWIQRTSPPQQKSEWTCLPLCNGNHRRSLPWLNCTQTC